MSFGFQSPVALCRLRPTIDSPRLVELFVRACVSFAHGLFPSTFAFWNERNRPQCMLVLSEIPWWFGGWYCLRMSPCSLPDTQRRSFMKTLRSLIKSAKTSNQLPRELTHQILHWLVFGTWAVQQCPAMKLWRIASFPGSAQSGNNGPRPEKRFSYGWVMRMGAPRAEARKSSLQFWSKISLSAPFRGKMFRLESLPKQSWFIHIQHLLAIPSRAEESKP
jgi:hypothetical protein